MRRLVFTRGNFLVTLFYVLKWHINYLLSRHNRPLAACVFLTNRCNLHCAMCSIWRSARKSELSQQDIIKIVDAVHPGCCYFSFSGGEPLLVKDIYEMIKYVSAKIPYVHLVSNGSLITPEAARALAQAGLSEISLSLDGQEPYHNNLRGDPASYKKVIAAIENIKQYAPRIRIVLNTVIFPDRLGQARYAVDLAGKMDIYAKVQPVNQHFRFPDAPHSPPEIDFKKTDKKELSGFVDYLLGKKYVLNSRFYLKSIPAYFSGSNYCPLIRPRCRLPYYFVEINPYRIVSPCMIATGWQEGVSIEEYAAGNEKFSRLQKKLEQCRKCDETMYICYWEALINMPLTNFIKYNFLR